VSQSLEERVAQLEAEVRLARDKQKIYDTLMQYCRGIDRCDADLVLGTYPTYDAKNIVDWLLANPTMTMHFIGNCLIDVHGDDAESESYFFSFHTNARDAKTYLRTRAGRYIHHWKRVGDGWITADRDIRDEWNDDRELEKAGDDGFLYGERGPGVDAAFHIRETLESGPRGGGALPAPR
jgi:hypothetical protein